MKTLSRRPNPLLHADAGLDGLVSFEHQRFIASYYRCAALRG